MHLAEIADDSSSAELSYLVWSSKENGFDEIGVISADVSIRLLSMENYLAMLDEGFLGGECTTCNGDGDGHVVLLKSGCGQVEMNGGLTAVGALQGLDGGTAVTDGLGVVAERDGRIGMAGDLRH